MTQPRKNGTLREMEDDMRAIYETVGAAGILAAGLLLGYVDGAKTVKPAVFQLPEPTTITVRLAKRSRPEETITKWMFKVKDPTRGYVITNWDCPYVLTCEVL